jgi:hypothetical protein
MGGEGQGVPVGAGLPEEDQRMLLIAHLPNVAAGGKVERP